MFQIICFFCVVLVSYSIHSQEILRPEQPVAFVGAMLLDGYESEPIHHSVVIFDKGHIVAVGEKHNTPIPEGTKIIDISGKTLMPGLIDAHVHVDLIGHGDYTRYYKFLGNTKRLHEVMPIAAKQMLRAGVTTISGPWITRIRWPGIPHEYEIFIKSPEEAAIKTKELIEKGADVIKVWAGLSEDDYRAVVDVAHQHGIKVHAHLYHPTAIRAAIAADVDVFQHVGSARNPPYDDDLLAQIAHNSIPVVQTISHRIWVYPATVAFPERLHNPVHKKDMPADIYAEVIDSFDNFHRLSYFHEIGLETRNSKVAAKQFIEAGAYMGVGTDAASPLNFHTEAMWYEMSALVDSGMTPIQVISAATKTNAEILGQFEQLGTIEPGKLADMIVIDGNPLDNIDVIANVEIVVKDGGLWYAESSAYGAVTEIGHAF